MSFLIFKSLCAGLFTVTLSVFAEENNNPCGLLYLTQSPYKNKTIQLNWNFTCTDPPDTILLTSRDGDKNKVLYKISPVPTARGSQETNISMLNVKLPGGWAQNQGNPDLKAKCFNYYISSERNNTVIFSECLSIRPEWMSSFGDLQIGDMMIPGTHNSGQYKGFFFLPGQRDYVLNQDKDFWEQLVYGSRYFDLRIARFPELPHLQKYSDIHFLHIVYLLGRLLPELQKAANFLKISPKEVIILEFYMFAVPVSFIKVSRSFHLEIINLIKDVFGDLIFPCNEIYNEKGPTLQELWSAGQQVIVSYNDTDIVKEFSWLCPEVNRLWGNKQTTEELEGYIKETISKPIPGNPMSVLMPELTPNLLSGNLKDAAAAVNPKLTDWVLENNFVDNINIIASDFFDGNDMINLAIKTNYKKLNKTK